MRLAITGDNKMKPTHEESLETMLNLVNDDILKFENIVIPFQSYIQQYGALDETKSYVKRFLEKIRG